MDPAPDRTGRWCGLGFVLTLVLASQSVATTAAAPPPQTAASETATDPPSGTDPHRFGARTLALLKSLEPAVGQLVHEVLERNPDLARLRHQTRAAAARADGAAALPDPELTVKSWLEPPQTRVGPQEYSLALRQRLPWRGDRSRFERIERLEVRRLEAAAEVLSLDLLTTTRQLAEEWRFLAVEERIIENERETLLRYERAAQARYAAGTGLQQEIVRIQAEITRVDLRLSELRLRRAECESSINRLRDRPGGTLVALPTTSTPDPPALSEDSLALDRLSPSISTRPRVEAARLAERSAALRQELAARQRRPALGVELSFTAVGDRRDAVGRATPPAGNGDDIVALSGSLTLPVWRDRLAAERRATEEARRAAAESIRLVRSEIAASLAEVTQRIPRLNEQLSLLEGVLSQQAREALRSAETAYSTGRLNAVDLLDAEVVLLEVRIALERTRADLALAWIELERATATPAAKLTASTPTTPDSPGDPS